MQPSRCARASSCPSDLAVCGGCRRPGCPYRHEASRRGLPPSGAPRAAAAARSHRENGRKEGPGRLPSRRPSSGVSISSVTNEDENAKQQCQLTAVFPCENQERNSKMSPFRSRQEYTKRSNFSTVQIEINLEESDDECDLVIDVPPQPVNKKRGIRRKCTKGNRDRELADVICEEKLCDSAIADIFECTEEKSEKISTLRKNSKVLNKREIPGNAFPKANEIYLPEVDTDTLKVLEEGDALAYTDEKHTSSSASIEADMQKGILKQQNAETYMLVEAFVQEHATNEDCVSSGRVTRSILSTGHSSKDISTTGRPYKEIINTEESQSTEVNCSNNSPEDVYPYPTYSFNKKKSEITLLSSSVEEMEPSREDTGLSEMDDNTLEECRRIFEEFERQALKEKKKDSDKQAHRRNEHINLLETEVNVPAKKRRIAHTTKFDVPKKKEMTPFNTSNWKQSHDAEIHQAHRETVKSAAKATRSQVSITTTSEQKKTKSRLSATQFPSTGPRASSNSFEVRPTATRSVQLCVPPARKVATAVPCRGSGGSVKKTIPVSCKVPSWQRSSVPQSRVKVPLQTRQRYVKVFFSECFKTCSSMNEAFNKAMKEEQSVYDRCGSKKMYLNLAVKTLKKLRDHGQLSNSSAGSMKSEDEKAFTGDALCELLKNYLLTEEQLKENNFPRPDPEKNGHAILSGVLRNTVYDAFKRLCCRCGKVYAVTASGEHRRKEECNYHSGRVLEQKVPGGMEKRYSCCDRAVGSDGCQIAKLHVHDGKKRKLEGFMKTLTKSPPVDGNYGVYALDCEMCYTTHGLELIRVAVVNAKLQVVYDTFVKPDGKIVDYDKRLSGVTENDLKNTKTSLRGVQAILLNLFSANTILIGHSLEDGLLALKLIHDRVVDTSVVFPHWQGLPYKRQLSSLVADYLRKIRQDDVCGHNSREDAIACMELMLWKVKEDNKRRK